MQVATFVIGEFATADRGALATIASIVGLPQTTPETQMYAVTAIAKMATRFGQRDRVQEVLAKLARSANLEVQQRAGEMARLLGHTAVCEEMLAPIEDRDETAPTAPKIVAEPAGTARPIATVLGDILLELDGPAAPASPLDAEGSLLGLLGRSSPVVSAPQVLSAQPVVSAQPVAPLQPVVSAPQCTEMWRQSDYVICGQARANTQDHRQIALNVIAFGTGQAPLSEFRMEFQAVPGWKVSPQRPDGSVLPPAGQGRIAQVVYLLNMNNAPFQMQIKVAYKFGAQPLSGVGTVTSLPLMQ
jgi:hypothetical protein